MALTNPALILEPSDLLPALTPDEARAINQQTQESIADLLRRHTFSPHTVRSYRSALRYWDSWHVAALGKRLPLLLDAPEPVSGDAVQAFIGHHRPVNRDGVLCMAMPASVLNRMLALGALGHRQVHKRSDRVDAHVPALATIRQRVAALNALHSLLKVTPRPTDVDPHIALLLRAVKRSAGDPLARPVLRNAKTPVTIALLRAMLRQCERDGLQGLQDAAILHACFNGGGRRRAEVCSMHLSDLTARDEKGRPAIDWEIRESKGLQHDEATGGVLATRLVGAAAVALGRWCQYVRSVGKPSNGPVWYRIRVRRGQQVLAGVMDAEDIADRIKQRVAEQGLDPDDYGAHSLRSGAITYGLEAGLSLEEVSRMAAHTNLVTTQRYYDRRKRSAADGAAKLQALQDG